MMNVLLENVNANNRELSLILRIFMQRHLFATDSLKINFRVSLFYRLQKLANELMSYFVTRGMGKDEYGGRVKLHATVINTKLRETDSESRSAMRNNKKPPVNSRISLDVREITKVGIPSLSSPILIA